MKMNVANDILEKIHGVENFLLYDPCYTEPTVSLRPIPDQRSPHSQSLLIYLNKVRHSSNKCSTFLGILLK